MENQNFAKCCSCFDKVEGQNIGDFVTVFVEDCTQGTLLGKTV